MCINYILRCEITLYTFCCYSELEMKKDTSVYVPHFDKVLMSNRRYEPN